MKAISLWQPWAQLIAIGAKQFETRSWSTRHRGVMAIHAGKHWTQEMALRCYQEPFFGILSRGGTRFPARLPSGPEGLGFAVGAVVAIADLIECWPTESLTTELLELGIQERAFGDFSHGRYAWQYEKVVQLRSPVFCSGRQGLFDLDSDVAHRIWSQL